MGTLTQTRKKIKLNKPPKYCNIFYNNEVTPFEFVVHIFCKVFNYDLNSADLKAREIHEKGKSVIFISSKEACMAKYELVEIEKKKINENNLEHSVEIYEEEEN